MLTDVTLTALETKIRDIVGEYTARNFTQAHVFRAVNAEYSKMAREALEADVDYFLTSKTYTLSAQYVTLPVNCWKIRSFLVYRDSRWYPIMPINSSQYYIYQQNPNTTAYARAIRFEGKNLYLEPGYANVTQLKILYSRVPAELEYGAASAGGNTSITIDTSGSLYDDVYIGDEIIIVSGTGSDQTNTITDYVGSTKVATVSTTWATNPDSTSYYSLVPADPINKYSDVLVLGAAVRIFHWRRDTEMHSVTRDQYMEEYDHFRKSLQPRQTDQPKYGDFVPREDDW